jgi:hypothetical protein
MYMMNKLDAYKQELERTTTWQEWYKQNNWRSNKDVPEYHKDLMLRYAQEMLFIHEDVKKYCNALLIKAQEHNSSVDRLIFDLRKLHEDYAKLDKKYKALRKKTTPTKKPAAKKVAKPKGT